MFKNHMTGIVFLLSGCAILSGLFINANWPLYLLLIGYLIWDMVFVASPASWTGRTPKYADDCVTRARTYMSWYLAFFGVLLGVFFTQSLDQQRNFVDLCSRANVPLYLVIAPFIATSIAMLFVPIQLEDDSRNSTMDGEAGITTSLKWLFFINVYVQKAGLVVFASVSVKIFAVVGSLIAT